jgi:hypothetical protein
VITDASCIPARNDAATVGPAGPNSRIGGPRLRMSVQDPVGACRRRSGLVLNTRYPLWPTT